MKTSLTIVALLLLTALSFNSVAAQEPPVTITGGALLRHGSTSVAAFQFGGNINVISRLSDSTGAVRGQVFFRPIAFFADDYFFDAEKQAELEGAQAITMVKLYTGLWSFGLGAGPQVEIQSGANNFRTVLCTEFGIKPIPQFQVSLGALYIPIGGLTDYWYPYLSVGVDITKLIPY